MEGFNGTTKAYDGPPENLYSHTDVPPTPVYDINGNTWKSSKHFLSAKGPDGSGLPIEYDYDGCCAWAIDQIFGLKAYESNQRDAVFSEVNRTLMHIREHPNLGYEEGMIKQNCVTWIKHWNTVWRHSDEGVAMAIATAKQLHRTVISDHYPINALVSVNYGRRRL